ncbi:polysaccharide deacetylase family protein [Klebsiella oxytoca]|uniref:polysaccharide deacetylase family protein n=1 Tax=Klebsiella oxytoca TaxID=571 RepID=UPI00157AD656|nr:polysaccharide deacetylase family protein [Klebsiella oxytoca]
MPTPEIIWELPDHQRFPWRSAVDAPAISWPEGKRLALYVAINLEHFAFGCPEGAKLSQAANTLDILNYSWRDYGNRVGAWYLADLFAELAIPPAVICNTAILDYCPDLLERWLSLPGSELIAHGHTNSQRQGDLDPADEELLIGYCQRRLSEFQGKPVSGWLSPWISESRHTPDILHRQGFRYNLNWAHDDLPTPMQTPGGTLLSVPYPQEINDIPTIIPNGVAIETFCQMIEDQFLELQQRSRQRPQVMGIALHPYIVGQPFRFYHLKQTLARLVAQCEDVWLTTPGEIAACDASLAS